MGTEHWPQNPDGTPEKAAPLELTADFPAYGGILLTQLEAFGIPFFTNRPGLGELGFLYGGFSPTGIQFFVPESRLEEAKAILLAPPAEDGATT